MGTRDEYVSGIKSAFVTLGSKAAMTALTAKFPIVANPFVGYLVRTSIENLLEELTDKAEMQVFFFYIDIRVNEQGRDFEKAAIANATAQRFGTPEEKAHAEKILTDSFFAFAKLTS